MKKDESALISAAIQARVDMGDLGGAEADLHSFKDQLADADLGPAWDAVNRALLQSIRTLPYTLRKAAIDKHFVAVLKAAETPDEKMRTILAQRHGQALQLMDIDYRQYQADPMAYLLPEIFAALKEGAAEGWLDPNDKQAVMEAKREVGLDLQQRIMGGPPRVLTNKEADESHHAFIQASPKDKVAQIRKIADEFHSHAGMALREIMIPVGTGHALAAELACNREYLNLAVQLMEVSERKTNEFGFDNNELREIAAAVENELQNTGFGRVLGGLKLYFGRDLATLQYVTGCRELILKLAMTKIESGTSVGDAAALAMMAIDGCYSTLVEDNQTYLLIPKGSNTEWIDKGLRSLRAYASSQNGSPDVSEQIKKAIWINIGIRLALVVPEGDNYRILSLPNGAPLLLDPSHLELMGKYSAKAETEVENG